MDVIRRGGRVTKLSAAVEKYSSNTMMMSGDFVMIGNSRLEHYPGQTAVTFETQAGTAEIVTIGNEAVTYAALPTS